MSKTAGAIKVEGKLLQRFEDFEQSLNGQSKTAWHKVRKSAMDQLISTGLPGAKDEEYKYTQISKAFDKEFGSDVWHKDADLTKNTVESIFYNGLEANVLVFVNGKYSAEYSNIISTEQGLEIKSLRAAYDDNKTLIDAHLGKYASDELDGYNALNTAFSNDGLFISIPKNTKVELPIIAYFINETKSAKITSQPRNLYLIGSSSEVDIIESFHTVGDNASFTNIVSEIVVEKNAKANYYKIESDRNSAYHVGNTQVHQERDSVFTAATITLGGALIRNNLNIVLDAENCEANMYGLTLLRGNQHVDNHTVVDHKMPNSYSNELYKNILDDKSTGVFNGKIYVRQDAQKTNAFQSNRNILLTNDASINTKPQLEIWADDVKCSHGATTGQIDKEQMFYLRARGLNEESARAMLLYAFAMDVLENVKIEALKEDLDKKIAERLHKNF